jgi:hypothetical protein
MFPGTEIDDDYPTCERTYATLRIFREDLDPDSVTRVLGIEPTRVPVKGQPSTGRSRIARIAEVGGWFLSTQDQVASRDVRRHLVWLLDKLVGSDQGLKSLQAEGYRMDVFCYWLSAQGHGGPILSPDYHEEVRISRP